MTQLWRLNAHVDFGILGELADRLAVLETSMPLDWSLYDEGDIARLDVLFDIEPDVDAFRSGAGLPASLIIDVSPFAEADRHLLQQPGLRAFKTGRFVLSAPPLPEFKPGEVGLEIDAGEAFGSGHHPSTRACLQAFDALLSAGSKPTSVLDMGCGSAILAIAAAKTLPGAPVIAVDSDAATLDDARANCQRGGVSHITCLHGEGYAHDQVKDRAFDLVFVNVYGPHHLHLMPGTSRALTPGGHAILSGLQPVEEARINALIEECGLCLLSRIEIDHWVTLVVTKRDPS